MYVQDEVSSRRTGGSPGLGGGLDAFDRELIGAGLISPYRISTATSVSTLYRLTKEGRELGRVFAATGEIPGYATSVVESTESADDDLPF
jgi:hypothetical protein